MSDLRIGVAGATGAVGQILLEVLHGAPWSPAEVVPLASAATHTSHVRYGDSDVAVDDLRDADWGGMDALLMALPDGPALEAGRLAMDEGVPVVDLSGALARVEVEVPLVVPWVNPAQLQLACATGAASTPTPTALMLASVAGPLRRAGFDAPLHATVILPASRWGRAGMEELSNQVIALFNSGTPSRKVFPEGLAFDLLPSVGQVGADGWTVREDAVDRQVEELIGAPASRTTLLVAPVFSGVSAALSWPNRSVPSIELLQRVLSDGGVGVIDGDPRRTPRPRRVDGEPFTQVGRLRLDSQGQLYAFSAMDNLRGASAAAVATLGAMLKERGYLS